METRILRPMKHQRIGEYSKHRSKIHTGDAIDGSQWAQHADCSNGVQVQIVGCDILDCALMFSGKLKVRKR